MWLSWLASIPAANRYIADEDSAHDEGMNLPELLTAGAAFVAIAVSFATYLITSRRDEMRWRRDELLAAMAQFLDGSFQRYSLRAFNHKLAGEPLEKYHDRSGDGRHEENLALTRLRLLASEQIVKAAEIVRAEDDAVAQWFTDQTPTPGSTYADLNRKRQAARSRLIAAYRKEFRLGRPKPLTTHPGGSVEWLKSLEP